MLSLVRIFHLHLYKETVYIYRKIQCSRDHVTVVNPFTPGSAKSKTDKFSTIGENWAKLKTKQHHSKVLLNSFPTNGHTLGFCTWRQKLENFVSPKVSLWESKG